MRHNIQNKMTSATPFCQNKNDSRGTRSSTFNMYSKLSGVMRTFRPSVGVVGQDPSQAQPTQRVTPQAVAQPQHWYLEQQPRRESFTKKPTRCLSRSRPSSSCISWAEGDDIRQKTEGGDGTSSERSLKKTRGNVTDAPCVHNFPELDRSPGTRSSETEFDEVCDKSCLC